MTPSLRENAVLLLVLRFIVLEGRVLMCGALSTAGLGSIQVLFTLQEGASVLLLPLQPRALYHAGYQIQEVSLVFLFIKSEAIGF